MVLEKKSSSPYSLRFGDSKNFYRLQETAIKNKNLLCVNNFDPSKLYGLNLYKGENSLPSSRRIFGSKKNPLETRLFTQPKKSKLLKLILTVGLTALAVATLSAEELTSSNYTLDTPTDSYQTQTYKP